MRTTDMHLFVEGAVAEVLEAMCFVSSEGEVTTDLPMCQPAWVSAELDFTGVLTGSFGIAVPPSTARTIAANFLGEDEVALGPEQTMEVIRELTNMVCGTLLARVNSRAAFTLSPPRPGSFDRFYSGGGGSSCTYAVDEGFISTWLDYRDPA